MLSAVGKKNILRKGQYKSGCSFVLQAHVYIILISSTFIIVYIRSFSRARLILTKKSNCLTSILNKLSQRKILLIREQTLIVTEEQIDNFSYGKNSYRYLSGQRTALCLMCLQGNAKKNKDHLLEENSSEIARK